MLEMGDAVRIIDLAHRMIRLSGRRIGTDVEVRVTGVRPGEKLTEELNVPEEVPEPTIHPSIVRLHAQVPSRQEIDATVRSLAAAAMSGDESVIRNQLFRAANRPEEALKAGTTPICNSSIDLTKDVTWSPSTI